MSKTNTYWVSYSFIYEYKDELDGDWYDDYGLDAKRFTCKKADVIEEVRKDIEEELSDTEFRNLKFDINDCYLTTDYEV